MNLLHFKILISYDLIYMHTFAKLGNDALNLDLNESFTKCELLVFLR